MWQIIPITPDPIAVQIGPIPIYWYGVAYAVAIAAMLWIIGREARRRAQDSAIVANLAIAVAVGALIGARLYHVIDQWELYRGDLLRIVLPPYSGLGIFGALIGGVIGLAIFCRWQGISFLTWMDILAPAVLVGQGIARWGNFANQELYGGPTNLFWGIAIDCAHRIPAYPCSAFPAETTGFHPLFLYESILSFVGAGVLLFLARRLEERLLPADLAMGYFVWYGGERMGLEAFRANNWTLAGIPTAQLVSAALIGGAIAAIVVRHRRAARGDDYDDEADEEDEWYNDEQPEVDDGGRSERSIEPAEADEEAAPRRPDAAALRANDPL